MDDIHFLPMFIPSEFEIIDGLSISAPRFCKQMCKSKNSKCEIYYRNLFEVGNNISVCPFGFNSYRLKIDTQVVLFTGLRIYSKFDRKKANAKLIAEDNNYILNIEQLQSFIESYRKLYEKKIKFEMHSEFVDEMCHDIRRFNAQIYQTGQLLYDQAKTKTKCKGFEDKALTINAFSSYISLKLDTYKYIYNENSLESCPKSRYNLFKICDKTRRCLDVRINATNKKLKVNLCGTKNCGDMIAFDSIEILPFLFLDNAIKYAPNGETIHINVEDDVFRSVLEINSIGPQLINGEIDEIVLRGFRSEAAKRISQDGSGFGLFIAKKICDLHEATLEISSNPETTNIIDGIKYSNFRVKVEIKK